MRRLVLVLLALALVLAFAPPARAAASMSLDAPATTVQLVPGESAMMAVIVHVRLEDAACPNGATLTVQLSASAVEGMQATLPESVQIQVPPAFYMRSPFEGEARADLTLTASGPGEGQVNLAAQLAPNSDCTVMGEASASATAVVRYRAAAADAPASPTPDAQPPAASPTPEAATPPVATAPTPRPSPSQAPLAENGAGSRKGPAALVPLLGVGVVGLIFFALGRLGHREKLGGDEEFP